MVYNSKVGFYHQQLQYQHTQENIMVGKHHATSRKARRSDRHLAPCKGIREIFYCGMRNPVKFCFR